MLIRSTTPQVDNQKQYKHMHAKNYHKSSHTGNGNGSDLMLMGGGIQLE
jgi:hypothetical protein